MNKNFSTNFSTNFLKDSTNFTRSNAFNYLPKSTKHLVSKNFILSKQMYGSGSNILKKSCKKSKNQSTIKGLKNSQSPVKLDYSQVPFRVESSLDCAGKENSKYSIDNNQKRKATNTQKCLMKTNYTNLKKLINQVTSLSPRGKYIGSPKSRLKNSKKKEPGKSKIMRCSSSLTMLQNSMSEQSSRKKMPNQKSSQALKGLPYNSTQNILSSTMATSHPTIAMFNSLIKNRKSSSKKRKKSKSNKSRVSYEHQPHSHRAPTRQSFVNVQGQNDSGNPSKVYKTHPKEDINTLVINICNDKPLMIKVNREGHENKEILLDCSQNNKKEVANTTPPFAKDLDMLKQRFTKVLNGYQQRIRVSKAE
ncbi:unnamed protein product [Moneuplotes crassus]|uniref:Uncharacterized protein n=1 Tax=Euplotes crassus TaxID=5936 RepID=A0AAD1UE49_EUPCR|nr:unnamed protein product [Moneuplotes crassus]